MRPDWLLSLTKAYPTIPIHHILLGTKPMRCIDPLLIRLIARITAVTEIYTPIESNPFLPPGNLSLLQLPETSPTSPILIDASLSSINAINRQISSYQCPITIITSKPKWRGMDPIAIVPPKTMGILPSAFWQGTARSFSNQYPSPLYIFSTTPTNTNQISEAIFMASLKNAPQTPPNSYTPALTQECLPE
jgi:hypothetical protein